MKVATLAVALLTTVTAAHLDARAVSGLQSISGPGVTFDCHLRRPEALGHVNRARRMILVRPWICARMNASLRDEPAPGSPDSFRTAQALLVLTHEAVHLSTYSGKFDEALTECRALQLVRTVALALGSPDEVARAYGHEALRFDARLPGYGDYRVGLGLIANYHATGCYEGGELDIHPESSDWPN